MTKPFAPQKLTFIDIFAGCGGLSLGLMQAGWEGVFAIEHNTDAFKTLNHNLIDSGSTKKFSWPEWLPQTAHSTLDVLSKYRSQLTKLEGKVDLIVGGPPCQGFSSAGRRDPNDPRNQLVKSYLEFVKIIKPKIVLIENVKGITQDFDDHNNPAKKINYSKQIIGALSKDYVVTTKMIDTSAFGVPQKRQRFFVIAIRLDFAHFLSEDPFDTIERGRRSFLDFKGISTVPVTSKSALSDLELSRNKTTRSRDTLGFEEITYRGPITAYQRLMHGNLGSEIYDTRLARHKPEIVERFKKIITICHAQGRLNVSLSAELKASFGLKKCAIRVLDPEGPSPTITSMPDDLIHYNEPRAMTVRENARLQSFPDWFAFQGKYTTGGKRRKIEVPRFTQVANAVPPLVAEAVGRSLFQLLNSIQMPRTVTANSLRALQKALDSEEALA